MSSQSDQAWKVLPPSTSSSRRGIKRGQAATQAKNEEPAPEVVENTTSKVTEEQQNTNATEEPAATSSSTRKTRMGLSRGKQSKRSMRKNNEEQSKLVPETTATSDTIVTESVQQVSNQQQTNQTTTAVTDIATNDNNTTNAPVNTASNVWEIRKQQNKKLEQNTAPVTSTQSNLTSSAYVPQKRLPDAVQPTKRTNVNTLSTNTREQDSIAVTAPTSSRQGLSQSGYQPPHKRKDNVEIRRFDDNFTRDKDRVRDRDRDRDRNNKPSFTNRDNRDRQRETTEASGTERSFSRADMGKGYERKSFEKGEGFSRENERESFSRKRRDLGYNTDRADTRPEKKRDQDQNEEKEVDKSVDTVSTQQREIKMKNNTPIDIAPKNNNSRFQAPRGDTRPDSTNLQKPASQKSGEVVTKTYSAPKEQLLQAVKLNGSIEQKDEKIMKIKQQMKVKAQSKPVSNTTVGGFQPVLSSAEDALRVTFDGDIEIARQNAELVKRELKTNLNPLGPEFTPEQHVPAVEAEVPLDQNQYVSDQHGYAPEQAMGVRMYPGYDINLSHGVDVQEPNINLYWSHPPSDSSIYAQDIGVEAEYEVNPYANFDRHQDMGLDSSIGRGPGNVPMGGVAMSGNGAMGGPPSQSPEHMSVSHPVNEAYNTQSTATMAAQSFPVNAPGSVLSSNFGHGDVLSQQIPSDAQQVALKAQEAIQQNPQMFSGYDYSTGAPGMIGMNSVVLRPPFFSQQVVDPAQMWVPTDDPHMLAWQQQQQQQRMRNMNPMASQGQSQQHFSVHGSHYKSDRGYSRRRNFSDRFPDNRSRKYRTGGKIDTHDQGNDIETMRKQGKKFKTAKKNVANYRTKDHSLGHHNDSNDDVNATANQWQNYSTEYTGGYNSNTVVNTQQGMETEEEKRKEDETATFRTLILTDFFFIIDSCNTQHIENYQDQLFQMSPSGLKTFRLELPSSPIQSSWVDKVKWTQLSVFLSRAPLELVIVTSHLQTTMDIYDENDYQALQPVAKFVSSLKSQCLLVEHAPCKITSDFIQSLSDDIKELKLLCPSIEWDVELVQSLNQNLNYLALICPTTITIEEFLDALGDKVQKLYLCNDESSSRKLSAEDMSKLFQHIFSLELDRSLLTEIRPMPKTIQTKTKELIIHLKGEPLEKDFYQKYSMPESITGFNIIPVNPSLMMKGWNDSNATSASESTTPSVKLPTRHYYQHEITGPVADDDIKLATNNGKSAQHGGFRGDNELLFEENKTVLNVRDSSNLSSEQFQSAGPGVELSPNVEKKMSFKDKVQSQNVAKKTSLRIAGGTQ